MHELPRTLVSITLLAALGSAQNVLHDLDPSAAGSWLGIGACGDVDGDGLPDFLLGDGSDSTVASGAGVVRVLSGPSAAVLFELYGGGTFDHFGAVVDGAGDVDADGFPDILAGGPTTSRARVWSGANGALLYEVFGSSPPDFFGAAVAGIGDVDLDGFDDFAVGAPQNEAFHLGPGYVNVFDGQTGLALATAFGPCADAQFGQAIAGLGDGDGDGLPEIAAYHPITCSPGVSILAPSGAVLNHFPAQGPTTLLPDAVASAGDVDGDGLPDVVVGSPNSGACGGAAAGNVKVYSLLSGAVLLDRDGEAGCPQLGFAVGAAGDWNGDGRDDVAAATASAAGYFDVFSGLDQSRLVRVQPPDGGYVGYGLARLGDLNGDGYVEIGATGTSAWVFSSCPGSIESYGAGCKGTNGFVPELGASGCPNPGQPVGLHLEGGFGGQPALLAIGLAPAQIQIGSAGGIGLSVCNLLVWPLLVVAPLGTLSGFGPGAGATDATIAIPAGTGGTSFYLQAAVIDPFTPNGFAVSNGIRIDAQ